MKPTSRPSKSASTSSGIPSTIRNSSRLNSSKPNGKGNLSVASGVDGAGRVDVEAPVHVLDNGINRTPVPLQRRHSTSALHGRTSVGGAGGEMGSFVLNSSVLYSDNRNSRQFSSEGQSQRSSMMHAFNSIVLESSMHSLSMMGDRAAGVLDASMNSFDNKNSSSVAGSEMDPVARERVPLITECSAVVPAAQWSEKDKEQWLRENTTVTLTETPTILLYTHQDEAVPNENREEVNLVKERNRRYMELEEEKRLDEGTRFQARGSMTFGIPKQSIYTEIRPPGKKSSGPMQVTPWMLKDDFAQRLKEEEDVDGDNDTESADEEMEEEMESAADEGATDESKNNVSSTDGAADAAGKGGAEKNWLFSESLVPNLRILERAVVQNCMEDVQLRYRGIEMEEDCRRVPPRRRTQSPSGGRRTIGALDSTLAGTIGNVGGEHSLDGTMQRKGFDGKTTADNSYAPPTRPSIGGVTGEGSFGADVTVNTASGPGIISSYCVSGEKNIPLLEAINPQGLRMTKDITLLWRYRSPLTEGRMVTCMAWNRKEPDILAVGYSARINTISPPTIPPTTMPLNGATPADANAPRPIRDDKSSAHTSSSNKTDKCGLICFWSLKNPLAPELSLHLHVEAGVTSIAFSSELPSLLAVGNTEGGIVVYDIHKDVLFPSIRPLASTGLHTGAVWELKWVPRGKERGEFLMSISADGRVVQWAVGKSIEKVAPDLMHLKRQPGAQVESAFVEDVDNGGRRRAREEAVLSQQSGGMCFDVCPIDTAIYVVGTEDSAVYQCNKSQTENYDLDYAPHAELVYRVRWSPYSARYFLTCSADWSSRLYLLGRPKPVLTFESPNQDAVQDIAWSYTNAVMFAAATAQGNIEIWTISEPICPKATVQYEDHRRLSAVLFAEQETPVVVVGDEKGDVTVFRLHAQEYYRQGLTDDEQEQWLEEAIRKQTT